MPYVLTEGSKVTCGAAAPHQGIINMTGDAKLVVGDSPVLTTQSVQGGSGFSECANPSNAGGPCTSLVMPPTAGVSTRLKVGDTFVVLETLAVTTDKGSTVKVQTIDPARLIAD